MAINSLANFVKSSIFEYKPQPAGKSPLYWEIETYNNATGEVVFWVKTTLSHTVNTVIYLFYTNASVTTFQSTATSVWDANFKGVWHYRDRAANTTISDSTSNGNNLTNNYNTSSGGVGKIGPGGFGNWLSIRANPANTSANTLSFWYQVGQISYQRGVASIGDTDTDGGTSEMIQNNVGTLRHYASGPGYADLGSLTIGTWYHVVIVRVASGDQLGYFNGQYISTPGAWAAGNKTNLYIGAGYPSAAVPAMDEVRMSDSARSADWVATEYANQNDPSTFYTVGAQTQNTSTSVTRKVIE